jgi:hypothetical protein
VVDRPSNNLSLHFTQFNLSAYGWPAADVHPEQVPTNVRELAGHGDGSDVLAPATCDPFIEHP